MAYVDLNPIRAKITRHINATAHTSVSHRLAKISNSMARLQDYLAPNIVGITSEPDVDKILPQRTIAYIPYLEEITRPEKSQIDKQQQWTQRASLLKRKMRAYGNLEILRAWCADRGWTRAGAVLI